jgi:hypothetical protein
MRYPIAVDASNREAGLELAIRALAPAASAPPSGSTSVAGRRCRSGTCSEGRAPARRVSNPRADLPDVLDFVASGRFDPTRVTARVVGRTSPGRVPRSRPGQGGGGAPDGVLPPDCSAPGVAAL